MELFEVFVSSAVEMKISPADAALKLFGYFVHVVEVAMQGSERSQNGGAHAADEHSATSQRGRPMISARHESCEIKARH